MTTDIYVQNIIEHYRSPSHYGKIAGATSVKTGRSPACGDEITIYVLVDQNKLKKLSFEGQGCAVSISSASLLLNRLQRKDITYLKNFSAEDLLDLLGISLSPLRIKCALLPLETLKLAIAD